MDSFFGIGIMELAFIAILALIVLGPERLPGAAREVAKVIAQIRAISSEFTSQFSEELQMLDEINPKKLADELVNETKNPPKKPQTKPQTTSTAVSRSSTKPASTAQEPAEQTPAASSASAGTEADEPVTDAGENTILPPTVSDNASAADRAATEPAINGQHGADAVDAEPESPAPAGASTASSNGASATVGDSAPHPADNEPPAGNVADSAPDSALDNAEKEA
jgi:sec-independent protein translocase protein TatB